MQKLKCAVPNSRECARLSSCRLTGRWASSLPARLSIENSLTGTTNASRVKSPLCEPVVRIKGSDTGQVGHQNSAGRSRVLRLRATLLRCWICYSVADESTKTVNSARQSNLMGRMWFYGYGRVRVSKLRPVQDRETSRSSDLQPLLQSELKSPAERPGGLTP